MFNPAEPTFTYQPRKTSVRAGQQVQIKANPNEGSVYMWVATFADGKTLRVRDDEILA